MYLINDVKVNGEKVNATIVSWTLSKKPQILQSVKAVTLQN